MKKLSAKEEKEIRIIHKNHKYSDDVRSIAYLAWQYGVDKAEIERVLESGQRRKEREGKKEVS